MRLVGDPSDFGRALISRSSSEPPDLRLAGSGGARLLLDPAPPWSHLIRQQHRRVILGTIRMFAWQDGYAVLGLQASFVAGLAGRRCITRPDGTPFFWMSEQKAVRMKRVLLDAGWRIAFHERG